MKRFIASFLLFLALFQVTIPKAEAGLGIASVSTVAGLYCLGKATEGDSDAAVAVIAFITTGVIGGAGAIIGTVAGGITAFFNPSLGARIIYSSLILDADGSLPQINLAESLSQKYSFIDNQLTIDNLSRVINQKYLEQKSVEDVVVVRLTESEIKNIFEAATLTESELAIIVNDFK